MAAPDNKIVRRSVKYCQPAESYSIQVDGKTLWNFASNDYLGFSKDPRIQNAAIEAIKTWGCGSTASPLISGSYTLHQQLIQKLCEWKTASVPVGQRKGDGDQEFDGLLFASGYSANVGICQGLFTRPCSVFLDRKNHASLIDGIRIAGLQNPNLEVRYYPHRNYQALQRLVSQSQHSERWIVTDSVFSMDGTIANADELLSIAKDHSAGVFVDEAHAAGFFGENLSGCFSFGKFEEQNVELISVGTFSKAMGAAGGFAIGRRSRIQSILQNARSYIFSTSIPPANVGAALAVVDRFCTDRSATESQQKIVKKIRSRLIEQGWQVCGDSGSPLLGVIVGSVERSERLASLLWDQGFWAPAIRPPTVKQNECRIRISPIAGMDDSIIEDFLTNMAKAKTLLDR